MSMISEQPASEIAVDPPQAPGRRRRWRLAAAGTVAVAVAAAVIVGGTRPFGGPAAASHGIGGTATQPVTSQSLSSQTQVSGSLGYARSYNVVVSGSASHRPPARARERRALARARQRQARVRARASRRGPSPGFQVSAR